MSSILWHTRDEDEASLRGSERAYMGLLVNDVAATFLPHDMSVEHARRIVGDSHYVIDMALRDWAKFSDEPARARVKRENLGRAMFGGLGAEVVFDPNTGDKLEAFSLALNTVLAVGNEHLQLIARLHGQCELHAWVDGPDRAWLADLIDRGTGTGVFRAGQGWDAVAALLRGRDDAPVVTSFTVCDPFPNSYVSDWQMSEDVDEDDEEAVEEARDKYYDLPHHERWDLSMSALRRNEPALQISPASLGYPFGHRKTVLDLVGACMADLAAPTGPELRH